MQVPHLVIVESDRMHYYRRMKEYYSDLNRAPLTVDHGAAAEMTRPPPRITEHVQSLVQKHIEASGLEGFEANFKPRGGQPLRHVRELRIRERVEALNRDGLFSERVKEINTREIENRARALEAKQRLKSDS